MKWKKGSLMEIRQAVKGIAAIDAAINSALLENMATVNIKAYQDSDMDQLLSDVENAINSINSFPEGAEKPIIKRLTSGGMGMVAIGISAKDKNISDIKLVDLAQKLSKTCNASITEIVEMGFPTKEITINIRENDLLRYNTLRFKKFQWPSVVKTIISLRFIRGNLQEMSIRSNDRYSTQKTSLKSY